MAQIEFKNVSLKYDEDKEALKNVNVSISEGEFVFIVGPSGAGKSSLIKILIREELPTQGDVLFNDQDILALTKEELPAYRRKIGVVFQDFKLLESKTVFENVSIALEVVSAEQNVINSVVPNVLTMVGLLEKKDKYPKQLSGGEKQRVSIARALAHEPDVLVADEPTGMIDPDAEAEVMKILEDINGLGTTIIMATHKRELVDHMKKRVIRIETGKVKFDKKKGTYND